MSKGTSIYRCAEISQLAYKHTPEFENKEKGIEGYIVREDGNCIVAFRGTAGFKDILSDIKAFPRKNSYTGLRMHYGFTRCVKSIWDELYELVKDDKNIIVTGHSLGGAEATVTAAFMVQAGLDVKALVTFGSPRVGRKPLTQHLRGVYHHRVVNGDDFVTSHPSKFWGYQHVSPAKHIGKSENRYSDHSLSAYMEALRHQHPIYL